MNLKVSILAVFCVAALVVSSTGLQHPAKNHLNVKSLPMKDRFMLNLVSKLYPQSFSHVPQDTFAEISDYPYMTYIDSFFVEARQLFTQTKKLSEEANLPEFNWWYHYDFCFWVICINVRVTYQTRDSKFLGVDTVKSKTDITPTSISNTFDVGSFNWTSPGFVVNYTDFNAERIHLNKNSYFSFENVTVAFSCDYEFVPDVGIQLGNLSIYFNAGKVRGGLQEFELWDFDGNLLDSLINDPDEYPLDESMMESWNYGKRRYTEGLQYSLNCFLSNGRSDSSGCMTKDGSIESDYYQFLNLQLLQTLGLGALLEL